MSSPGTVSLEHRVGALEQRLLEAAREAADLRQRLRLAPRARAEAAEIRGEWREVDRRV